MSRDQIDHVTIYEKLAKMDTKLDFLIEARADQETRLRTLEKHRNWFAGVLAAAGATGTTAAAFWENIVNVFKGVS